jgi:hypothetical protein
MPVTYFAATRKAPSNLMAIEVIKMQRQVRQLQTISLHQKVIETLLPTVLLVEAMSDPHNPNIATRETPQWGLLQRELFWQTNDGKFAPFNTGK